MHWNALANNKLLVIISTCMISFTGVMCLSYSSASDSKGIRFDSPVRNVYSCYFSPMYLNWGTNLDKPNVICFISHDIGLFSLPQEPSLYPTVFSSPGHTALPSIVFWIVSLISGEPTRWDSFISVSVAHTRGAQPWVSPK